MIGKPSKIPIDPTDALRRVIVLALIFLLGLIAAATIVAVNLIYAAVGQRKAQFQPLTRVYSQSR